jgi:hypothetical protein
MKIDFLALAVVVTIVATSLLHAFKAFSTPYSVPAKSVSNTEQEQHRAEYSIIASDANANPISVELSKPDSQSRQPSSNLPAMRVRLDHSRNYRAFVHAALSNPNSESVRVSLLAIERCAQLRVSKGAHQSTGSKATDINPLANRVKERRADCEAGGGIDRQMERAVRTIAKTMANNGDRLLALALKTTPSADPSTKELIRLHGDTELALALGVTAIGTVAERTNIAPGLEKVPGDLFSIAWAAEVCARRQCDEVGLQSMQCDINQLCTQSSYSEQLTVLATTKLGVPIEVWLRLRSALGARVEALFTNSPAN